MDLTLGLAIPFYNGEETLYFCSAKNGKPAHEYYRETPDGLELVDGVTTVCGILDKSQYLMPWATKMMAEKLISSAPRDRNENGIEIIPAMSKEFFFHLVENAKKRHKEIFEDAGDVGTLAHKWIEESIKWAIRENDGIVDSAQIIAPTDERAENCGNAAFDWMAAHNVRWLRTEKIVYSRELNIAGTMDGLAVIDGCTNASCCSKMFLDELSLVDWKSSNHLRVDYLYQTAAYVWALQEEEGLDIRARHIIRLGKEKGEFEPWYLDKSTFENDCHAFVCCLNLRRAHKAVEQRMSEAKKLRTFKKREEKKAAKEKNGKK
jgi:hypothetical protein